ncbi:hypothetical protein [Catonella sp.]|uniref:hypothetical protein n=1 Tax=Catonella sp. TaxID=2382125 RepID=UPI003FA07969
MCKKEEMVEHLLSCKECNDELEIYYTIINCLKEIEGKIETSDNYHGEYTEFIEKTKNDIRKYKNNMLKRRIAFPGVVGAAMLLTGVNIKTETDVKIAEVKESKTLINNDLSMRFRFSDSKVLPDIFMDMDELAREIGLRRRLYEK